MAKKDKTNAPSHSEFISGALALLDRIAQPVPKDATPFEIAQHAAARVRMSQTADAEMSRELVKNFSDELITRYRTETQTLA
ncbi:hypothetical protein SEA_ALOEVERA_31 [Microbacterium phage AloeVera]|uniref:Uncharacterized protein n=3 Tax=Akonivirus akoni TaxID=2845587 RepID=A0A6M3T199_9CAUD|nr:hypothetical protein HWC17_gp30 [Microbacterium phage Akoni]QCG78316.1 hypothetical protein SEA_AKONI_30 [Microbacterium phage Akoni]QJD51280.1 hypothetical protein SEA_TRUONG_30 [Microbacterium phage Truong]QJD51770.1 hypothetical protein SEA_ASHTON_31 [Microbacterium phage Ashton]